MCSSALAPTRTGAAPWAWSRAISAPGSAVGSGRVAVAADDPVTPAGSQAIAPGADAGAAEISSVSPDCRSRPLSVQGVAVET